MLPGIDPILHLPSDQSDSRPDQRTPPRALMSAFTWIMSSVGTPS